MNTSHKVDVIVATDGPAPELDYQEPAEPIEQVDVTPDPHRRIIFLAETKQAGYDEARALGIEPVAVITPRSLDAARGIEADALMDSSTLAPEMRDQLLPHALPSIATTETD